MDATEHRGDAVQIGCQRVQRSLAVVTSCSPIRVCGTRSARSPKRRGARCFKISTLTAAHCGIWATSAAAGFAQKRCLELCVLWFCPPHTQSIEFQTPFLSKAAAAPRGADETFGRAAPVRKRCGYRFLTGAARGDRLAARPPLRRYSIPEQIRQMLGHQQRFRKQLDRAMV